MGMYFHCLRSQPSLGFSTLGCLRIWIFNGLFSLWRRNLSLWFMLQASPLNVSGIFRSRYLSFIFYNSPWVVGRRKPWLSFLCLSLLLRLLEARAFPFPPLFACFFGVFFAHHCPHVPFEEPWKLRVLHRPYSQSKMSRNLDIPILHTCWHNVEKMPPSSMLSDPYFPSKKLSWRYTISPMVSNTVITSSSELTLKLE